MFFLVTQPASDSRDVEEGRRFSGKSTNAQCDDSCTVQYKRRGGKIQDYFIIVEFLLIIYNHFTLNSL